jgi:acyl-CoA synthetase (AMP-forming)/AMP-acid ligase II
MSTILDAASGSLTEPMTGCHWDRSAVLDSYRRRLAFYERRGLERGNRLFLHYGNTPEFFVDLLPVRNLGGCAVPIDSRLTPFEVEILARAALPRLSLWSGVLESETADRLCGLSAQVVDASEAAGEQPREGAAFGPPKLLDDDALIPFTSGTTGQPQGVVHTHRSLRERWTALRRALGLESFRRTLCLLPTHFGHGLICNCLFPWLYGQDLFIVPPF